MYMCTHTYVYVYTYMCICVCICVHIHMYMCTHTYVYVYTFSFIFTSNLFNKIHMYMGTHINVHVCKYLFMCVHSTCLIFAIVSTFGLSTCVKRNKHILICIHTKFEICLYVCIHTFSQTMHCKISDNRLPNCATRCNHRKFYVHI